MIGKWTGGQAVVAKLFLEQLITSNFNQCEVSGGIFPSTIHTNLFFVRHRVAEIEWKTMYFLPATL